MSVKRAARIAKVYRLADADRQALVLLKSDYVVARANNTRAEVYLEAYNSIKERHEKDHRRPMDAGTKIGLKKAIQRWFSVNCRRRRRDAKIGTRNYSAREIFCKEDSNKELIMAEATELWNAAEKGDKVFSYYQKAVSKLWKALPADKKAEYHLKAIEFSETGPPMDIRIQ
jgi:hypothetical protein